MARDPSTWVKILTCLLLLAASALLLVSSLSTPIIKSLSFVQASETLLGQGVSIKAGLWGACTTTGKGETCSKASLGFKSIFSSSIPGVDKVGDAVGGGLSFVLVLHPIAAGFSLFALLLVVVLKQQVWLARIAHLAVLATVILTAITLAFDLILFNALRVAVQAATPLNASFGSAFFLVLVALVVLVLALLMVARKKKMLVSASQFASGKVWV